MSTLFVCGSLCSGMVHFKKIESFVKVAEPASISATVYRLEVGYPVLLKMPQHTVHGHALEIEESDTLHKLLNEFHGFNAMDPIKSLHTKEEVQIQLQNGDLKIGHAYFLNPAKLPKSARIIDNGDWVKSLSTNPPATVGLSDEQIKYILKLGASTGREIIPVDLKLYRELMNKGLIVDKGRRLALTNLGKEVYRYL